MNATTSKPLPAIPDLETGLRLISELPLGKPEQALTELRQILDELARTPPAAEVYIEFLEQARTSLCFVAEELARGYTNKALPLGAAQERCFRLVADTWRTVAHAYQQCALLASDAHGTRDHAHLALGLQRSVSYAGLCVMEHYRARRELPSGVWQEMHASYTWAETRGIETEPVADVLDPRERSTHCASTLISVLLTELAGPYGLSPRDLVLVRRWADSWAPLVGLHSVDDDEPLPPFVIDLQQDSALYERSDQEAPPPSLRCLELSRLALQLRDLHHQLTHKAAPSEIGLGEDCTAGQCRRLLEHLLTAWSRQLHGPRKYRRRPATGHAAVCSGFDAMHFFISGTEFAPPEKQVAQTHSEYERLFAFPQMVDGQTLQVQRERRGLTCEQWEVVNQSAKGFRLRHGKFGKPVAHGQLLAIRPQDGTPFLLARINWLMQAGNGELIVGVEVLPGIPQAIAARPLTQTEIHNEPFGRAFLLPASPAFGAESSLLLPAGWYRPSRIVEIVASASHKVELLHVLDEGPNYEHVSFAAAR